jgi:hypothetical protein
MLNIGQDEPEPDKPELDCEEAPQGMGSSSSSQVQPVASQTATETEQPVASQREEGQLMQLEPLSPEQKAWEEENALTQSKQYVKEHGIGMGMKMWSGGFRQTAPAWSTVHKNTNQRPDWPPRLSPHPNPPEGPLPGVKQPQTPPGPPPGQPPGPQPGIKQPQTPEGPPPGIQQPQTPPGLPPGMQQPKTPAWPPQQTPTEPAQPPEPAWPPKQTPTAAQRGRSAKKAAQEAMSCIDSHCCTLDACASSQEPWTSWQWNEGWKSDEPWQQRDWQRNASARRRSHSHRRQSSRHHDVPECMQALPVVFHDGGRLDKHVRNVRSLALVAFACTAC